MAFYSPLGSLTLLLYVVTAAVVLGETLVLVVVLLPLLLEILLLLLELELEELCMLLEMLWVEGLL